MDKTETMLKSPDSVREVYEKVDFLTIRSSLRRILSLTNEEIEEFVQKYSIIIIYLLNVTDPKASAELMERLSNTSLMYLIEEELRTVLIRFIALSDGDFDEVLHFSQFIDSMESEEGRVNVCESASFALEQLYRNSQIKGNAHFSYLNGISSERLNTLVMGLIARNIHTALAAMAAGEEDFARRILDGTAFYRPKALKSVPFVFFRNRLSSDYRIYRKERVKEYLPDSVKMLLAKTEDFYSRFADVIREITEKQHERNRVMDLCYLLTENCDPEIREIFLTGLRKRGIINDTELQVLRSFN